MPSEPVDAFGCELVTHRLDREGYAFHGKTRAHIHAWVGVHGAVSEGLVLDHLCRRRNCRAVHHLEPVTQSENEKRKRLAYRLRRQRCQFGHDLNVSRVLTPEGGVVCRACNQKAKGKGHVTHL